MYFSIIEEIRKRPFIRIVIPFIIGIIITLYYDFSQNISLCIFGVSLLLFLVDSFFKKLQQTIIRGILINLIFLSSAMFVTQNKVEFSKSNKLSNSNELLIGEISDDIKIKENNVSFNIEIKAIKQNDIWIEAKGKLLLYLEKSPEVEELQVGDIITFSPHLSDIENKGNPEEFDYKKYLSYHLIYQSDYLSGSDWKKIETNGTHNIKYKALRFRINLIKRLEKLELSNDELSVVSALALGYQYDLSSEIRHAYSSSGAAHILAVSGLHVGIIYGILMFLFSFIKNKKYAFVKVFFVLVLIWFYAVLTGLSPSVSRAALMFSIAAIGSLQKNKATSLNTISISAFILLIINPFNLVNIGFQLSYLAVIGIIIIQPHLQKLWNPPNKFLNWFWSLTTVSLAAQIATAPVCIYYFNQFSTYFLLTNYVLIPISTVAIWLCVSVFALSWIPYVNIFLTKILAYVVKAMNYSVIFIENLPFSVIENRYINSTQMLILYLIIIFIFLYFFIFNRYKYLLYGLCFFILFFGIHLYHSIQNAKQKSIIIYNINGATAINLIDGRDNILFANLDNIDREKIAFSTKNNWLKKGLEREKYINLSYDKNKILTNIIKIDNKRVFFKRKFIGFEDCKIFVLDKSFVISDYNNKEKIKINYLVISNNPKITIAEISRKFDFDEIIIDSSNSNYFIEKFLSENVNYNYKIHNVKTQGAFIKNY